MRIEGHEVRVCLLIEVYKLSLLLLLLLLWRRQHKLLLLLLWRPLLLLLLLWRPRRLWPHCTCCKLWRLLLLLLWCCWCAWQRRLHAHAGGGRARSCWWQLICHWTLG